MCASLTGRKMGKNDICGPLAYGPYGTLFSIWILMQMCVLEIRTNKMMFLMYSKLPPPLGYSYHFVLRGLSAKRLQKCQESSVQLHNTHSTGKLKMKKRKSFIVHDGQRHELFLWFKFIFFSLNLISNSTFCFLSYSFSHSMFTCSQWVRKCKWHFVKSNKFRQ